METYLSPYEGKNVKRFQCLLTSLHSFFCLERITLFLLPIINVFFIALYYISPYWNKVGNYEYHINAIAIAMAALGINIGYVIGRLR